MRIRFAAFAAVCLFGVFARVPNADAQTTALYFDSQPGDYIGGGVRQTWTDADLTFTAFSSTTASSVGIRADNFGSGGGTWWDLRFESADGTVLAPGVYDYAGDVPFRSPLRPGLSIEGSGRACDATGRFVIYEIAFDSAGTLIRFAADFEQHCDETVAALFGAIRYDSTRSNLIPFDSNYPVYAMHVDTSPYGRVTGGGLDCGNGGSTCDLQYAAGASIVLTATPAPGYVFLAWSADCSGAQASFTVVVTRRKQCSALFDAAPSSGFASPLGSGNRLFVESRTGAQFGATRWVMQSTDSQFRVNGNTSVAHVFVTSYSGDFWSVDISAPQGQPLIPGVYERAVRSAFASVSPGFDLGGLGRGCNTVRARFVVYEYSVSGAGEVERLSADFEHHCEGQAPAVFGSIRYNASRQTLVPFDGAYPVYSLTIDPPVNGSVIATGIDCGVTGTDCEEVFSGSGAVALTATPAPGHVFVGWTGDCFGTTVSQITVISRHVCGAVFDDMPGASGPLADALRLGSLFFYSERGEYIGGGRRHLWTRPDAQIVIDTVFVPNPTRTASFRVKTPDASDWGLVFAASEGQSLRPGDFTGATRPFHGAGPGLDVSGHGIGCNELRGRFRIYEVEFDTAGKVTKFAADFEQHCEGITPALFGAIRYNSTRASVLPFDGEFLPRPDMTIDLPLDGSTVAPAFTVAGWALNSGEISGTGVDAVHVYAFPLAGGGPIFLGVATYGGRRDDVGARFGSQFRDSGFSLASNSTLSPGRYMLAAIAHDTVTGTFNTVRTATVTVAVPVSNPRMAIESPAEGASVIGAFRLDGWAIDTGAPSGPGVDAIHVYAFKSGNNTPIFLGVATYGIARPDLAAIYGAQFGTGGYHLDVSGLSSGSYLIWVGARSTVSGQFAGITRTITVPSTTAMSIDTPSDGRHVTGSFPVAGWALDAAGPSGAGVDAVHAWAVPANGGAPIFLGAAGLNWSRPDIGAIYGARFSNVGYAVMAPALAPGTYTIAVFARSTATGTFNQMKTVTVIVD